MNETTTFTPEELFKVLEPYLLYLDIENENDLVHLDKWSKPGCDLDIQINIAEAEGGTGLHVWTTGSSVGYHNLQSLEELRFILGTITQVNLDKLRSLLELKTQGSIEGGIEQ